MLVRASSAGLTDVGTSCVNRGFILCWYGGGLWGLDDEWQSCAAPACLPARLPACLPD